MTPEETIHCPMCGLDMFTVDFDDPESLENEGRACPNQCGWISVEQQGEDLAVMVSPCTY